jgi:hypothetical protein
LDDTRQKDRQAKSAVQRWIRDPNDLDTYIKLVQASDTAVDSIDEVDLNPYFLTEYEVGDYVLRRYPATKIGQANPSKYGSWWRGPYLVTAVTKVPMVYGFEKLLYTIQNLVTTKEYFADITHLKPFYFDPNYVTPLKIATRDTDECVVLQILEHDFSDTENKLWPVQRHGDDAPSNTWENLSTLKDVEAFHQYCAKHRLNAFLPKEHPQFSASKPSTQRRNSLHHRRQSKNQ